MSTYVYLYDYVCIYIYIYVPLHLCPHSSSPSLGAGADRPQRLLPRGLRRDQHHGERGPPGLAQRLGLRDPGDPGHLRLWHHGERDEALHGRHAEGAERMATWRCIVYSRIYSSIQ